MTLLPGWQTFPLGELVDVLDNKRIPLSAAERKHREGPVPYYGATGKVGTIDKPLFDEPLVLLGEDGVQFFDPYKPKAYKIAGPSWVNNHAHVLRPKAEVIEFGYLLHYLNAFDYQGYANGTTRLKLTQGAMNSIPVHLPPLEDQRLIVESLDDHLSRLDKALAEIAAAKSLVEKFAPSLFHKLTSDDSHQSRRIPFKDFITLQRGFDLPKQDRKSGSVPIVGSNGVLGFHDEARVRGPGVVTGRSGTIGRVHFIEDDFWALNTTLYVKDFKGNLPLFVYEYLQTLDLKHFAGGSTVPSLDRNVLNDVEVEVPTFERQIEISREMALQRESMLEVLSRVSQLDSEFHQIRRSALNAAFTGTLVRKFDES